jgi:two-component system sensor histidine kinase DesK
MLQVRQVAHESLREMRAVVSGYRTADLGTELAGAQEVLRSAGMSCRVTGDAAGLPRVSERLCQGVIEISFSAGHMG